MKKIDADSHPDQVNAKTPYCDGYCGKVKNRPVRIMIINTPFVDMYGPIKVAAGRYFPIALGSLAAYAISKGNEVQLLDPEPQGLGYADIKKRVEEYKPDLLGMTCATANFVNALKISEMAKEVCDALVVVGGAHVSSYPVPALRAGGKNINVVILREGEEQLDELCQYLQGRVTDLKSIKGIAFRSANGEITNNGIRPFIENLDILPYPAYNLINLDTYKPNVYKSKGTRTATIMTSRGCPALCIYCASHKTLGRGFRANSPEYVTGLIEYLVKDLGVDHISIEDDVFTLDVARAKKICQLLIDRGLNKKIKWSCFSRVVGVDEELFVLMKKAGCYAVSFGCESGDDQMLKNMKKGTTVELNRRAIQLCHKVGLRSIAFFIFGTPGETKESIEKTIQFALKERPTMAFFNVMTPFPGTELFDLTFTQAEQDKIQNWEDFVGIALDPQIKHQNLTTDELRLAGASAFRRFYFSPRGMFNVARSISSFRELRELMLGSYGLMLQLKAWWNRADEKKEKSSTQAATS